MADALIETAPLDGEPAKAVTEVDDYDALIAYHTSAAQAHRAAATKLRRLKNLYTSLHNKLEAKSNKRKARDPVVSGFNRPVRIKPELAAFLEMSGDDRVTRHEVTRFFTAYFKKHDLPNPDNRREIRMIGEAGAKLRALFPDFGTTEQPLSYFNLQKALKGYFVSDCVSDAEPTPASDPAPDPELAPGTSSSSVTKIRKVVRGVKKA
jgi:chromatin remodeling complex protein RSC6